jgi:hypothetical protein
VSQALREYIIWAIKSTGISTTDLYTMLPEPPCELEIKQMSEENFNEKAAQDMPGFFTIEDKALERLREVERLARAVVDEEATWAGPHTQLYLISNEMEDLLAQLRAALGEDDDE